MPIARAVRRLAPDPPDGSCPGFAAVLSGLLPGLGQAYRGQWRRAAFAAGLPLGALALVALVALAFDPLSGALLRRAQLVVAVLVGGALVYHAVVTIDAFAGGPRGLLTGQRRADYIALGIVLLVLVGGWGTMYRHSSAWAGVASKVFTGTPPAAANAAALPATTPPPVWSGRERLNVLLLGIDSREGGTTQNTDTMMVLTLDPVHKTAGMLSIPRDTLIDRRGLMRDKINAAYAIGGPELARRAAEDLLLVPIHSWALINFEAFTKIVDGAGGAVIDVRRPIRDEFYPTAAFGVQRVSVLAGPQTMSGDEALRYARTRYSSNDYDRSVRQQDVLSALRARLADGALLLRIPAILDSVGGAVSTSFDPEGVLPVARLVLSIDRSSITGETLLPCGAGLPHCELVEDNRPGGFYLIPDRAKIADLVKRMFP